jgi:hypothetical protein
MKDYSEEIDLIVLELFGSAFAQGDMGMVTSKKATDKASTQIKSLFREIVKEALPNEIPKKANDGGIFEQEKRGYINGFNNARSEILSNIEKVIK